MNVLLLPKELQVLISEFNVEHRPRMKVVLNELQVKYNERINTYEHCENCGSYSNETYSTYILFHKYTFCGEWCKYERERELRKSYRKKSRM